VTLVQIPGVALSVHQLSLSIVVSSISRGIERVILDVVAEKVGPGRNAGTAKASQG